MRARLHEIGIETFQCATGIEFGKAKADETGVPGVKAVPPTSRRIVFDVAALRIDRIDDVCEQRRRHALLAEQIICALRRGRELRQPRAVGLENGFAMLLVQRQCGQPLFHLRARAGADLRVEHPLRIRCQVNRSQENIGEMSLAVAFQNRLHMILRHRLEKHVQIFTEILAHFGFAVIPGDAVEEIHIGIFKNNTIRRRPAGDHRLGMPDLGGKFHLRHIGGGDEREPVKFKRLTALGNQFQLLSSFANQSRLENLGLQGSAAREIHRLIHQSTQAE